MPSRKNFRGAINIQPVARRVGGGLLVKRTDIGHGLNLYTPYGVVFALFPSLYVGDSLM